VTNSRTQEFLLDEKLTHSVIGAFYEVYRQMGFGFAEYLYTAALERELLTRGHEVAREVFVMVRYKNEDLGKQRLDMVVDHRLVVEAKATHDLHRSARHQLYNYLRATRLKVGLLLHFGPRPLFYRIVCSKSV
jgi:GxxExxY protein